MKKLIFLLILITIAVWFGLKIKADPGYVLMSYQTWTVEMPLWLFIFGIVITFFLLRYITAFLGLFSSTSERLHRWSWRRKRRRSLTQTSQGLIELAEGHWQKSEKLLMNAVHDSETPLINYLSAARAAQELGAYERRDNYLRLAHQTTPEAEMAVGLTQAELQFKHGQYEQSLATLKHLKQLAPKHPYITKLLQSIYKKLNDWESLLKLIPLSRKQKLLSNNEITKIEKNAYQALFDQAMKRDDIKEANNLWKSLPTSLHQDKLLIEQYVKILVKHREYTTALQIIKTRLKKGWDDDLIKLYSEISSDDPLKQLSYAESWLKYHKENPTLLLALGKLCIQNALWGKARHYLETSINIAPNPQTYAELGHVLEQLGEAAAALEHYRQGLALQKIYS